MLKLHCLCATYRNMRTNNEDNYYFNSHYALEEHTDETHEAFLTDEKQQLFAVFDGLGGEENGETASYIAAKTLAKLGSTEGYYAAADKNIKDMTEKKSLKISGTTAVIVTICNGYFSCSNIGDSRAYLIRGGDIIQQSVDHTSLQTLLAAGIITKEQAEKSRYKNTLSQCLGINEEDIKISPYIGEAKSIEDGDIFLICSDGLTKLNDDDISKIILSGERKTVCQRLFEAAVKVGSKDNVTIILIYAAKGENIFKKIKHGINKLCGK